jgi:site-specific DNA recombinase
LDGFYHDSNGSKKGKEKGKMKAIAYLRVSGRKQIGGSGFDRQLERIKKYCAAEKWDIERVYKEQVTGTADETKRPVFMEMVADMTSNGVKTVIVESLDRLARELRIQEQLLIYLSAKGIDLVSANTGENVTQAIKEDPIRKLLVQMQGAFAEFEKNQILLRLRKGREKKRKETGKCGGPVRYGETPEEKEVLKTIAYLRRLGRGQTKRRSYRAIAQELNARNIPTKSGKKWTSGTVYNAYNR